MAIVTFWRECWSWVCNSLPSHISLLLSGSDSLTLNLLWRLSWGTEDSYVSIAPDFTARGKDGRRLSYPLQPLLFISLGWVRTDLHARSPSSNPDSPTVWLRQGLLWASRSSFLSGYWQSEVMMLSSHAPCGKEASQRPTHPQTGCTQSHMITHNLTCAHTNRTHTS